MPWEQSFSGGDAHYTLLGSLIHICVYCNQLTGILFVPSNGFMLRKSLWNKLKVFGEEKFGCLLVKTGGLQLLV